MKVFIRLIVIVVVAGIGTSAVALAIVPQVVTIATAHDSTSSLPDLTPLAQRSVMYAADGSVIAVLNAEENRREISLAEVPKPVVDTILAVEDEDSPSGTYHAVLYVKFAVVLVSGVTAFLHARARSNVGLAVFGALTGVSALAALVLGIVLAG